METTRNESLQEMIERKKMMKEAGETLERFSSRMLFITWGFMLGAFTCLGCYMIGVNTAKEEMRTATLHSYSAMSETVDKYHNGEISAAELRQQIDKDVVIEIEGLNKFLRGISELTYDR